MEVKGSCTAPVDIVDRMWFKLTVARSIPTAQRIDGVSATGPESLKVTGLTPTSNTGQLSKDSQGAGREETTRVDPWNFLIQCPVLNWNVQPDERDYTVGITVCWRQKMVQHACWLFSSMASAQIPVDVFACSATISACEKASGSRQ